MLSKKTPILMPPRVQLIGDTDHRDFRETIALLRTRAQIATASDTSSELIVIAQSRPAFVEYQTIEKLRRESPLSGAVALLGSWCEGETRTGRAWPGIERFYWYEFPAWWQRQLTYRAAGRCPTWLRPEAPRFAPTTPSEPGRPRPRPGVIALHTPHRETAAALTDLFHRAGYASIWQPTGRSTSTVRGAVAGIWEGGQLDSHESEDLEKFCRRLNAEAAPVVALLDFPRRDKVDLAMELGAGAVLGKPWVNVELIDALNSVIERKSLVRAA